MKILCIGDVVSKTGAEFLLEKLPRLKRLVGADITIVNGENSALFNGINKVSFDMIMSAGADVVTGGNHSFQKKDASELHDSEKRLLRPANIPCFDGGRGELTLELGACTLRVINISGTLFMKEECQNPFEFIEKLLETDNNAVTVVDFHAETTAEKRAMGYFLDGKVSLVFGTHTHVQTNDAQILPCGTGYITDLGMTGIKHSVLGKGIKSCVHNFRYPDDRVKIEDDDGECILSGIVADIDISTKKCTHIETVNIDNNSLL